MQLARGGGVVGGKIRKQHVTYGKNAKY